VPISPLRFGLVVVTLSTLFNALTVHAGRTVLFTIPGNVPLISGTVTLEAALYGLLNGLVIAALFAAFMLMTRAVAVRDLIRFIPRAFYPLAVVISIALTFVPTTLRQFHQIREAQAVRGHRMRGLRSWLPLFLPLLTGGMERALQLAEAMMARGFAGADIPHQETRLRVSTLTGLALVAAGLLLRMAWQQRVTGGILLLMGIGVIALALHHAGRRHPHTVYRKRRLQPGDWIVIGAALATALLFLVPLPGVNRASLYYMPYPEVTLPTLSVVLGAATWGLLAPAAVLGTQLLLSAGNDSDVSDSSTRPSLKSSGEQMMRPRL
jgi:energy-coupling factor transport system permease protein